LAPTEPGLATGAGLRSPAPVVELQHVTKRYGAVVACDRVDLALRAGEIHGVLGENGAGKSTLMKVLIGLVEPDEGRVLLDGSPRRIPDPQTAAALGIGMVHQHFSLVEPLTVWENVLLGETVRLDRNRARDLVAEIGEHYGLQIDPDATVGELSAGLRQRVELIKCLRRRPRVVVLDEPTSVLTPQESDGLFAAMREVVVRDQQAVVLVSHKLAEVLRTTDVVTIMRQGRVVEQLRTAAATAPALARAMVGRAVSLRDEAAALGATDTVVAVAATTAADVVPDAPIVLRIRDATVRRHGHDRLSGLDLEVRAGEIVGVAGVEGNGQRELGDVLSSLIALDHGIVEVAGRTVRTGRAGAMARAGVAVIPEDRHDSGCALDMSVAENLVVDRTGQVSRFGFIDRRLLHRRATELMATYDITAAGPGAPMRSLSGGNQQRVVLARELSHRPAVLVAAQPTRGLDVGAIEYISSRLRAAAADGIGVLLISTELDEILDLADRIVVMSGGMIIGTVDRTDASLERLGLLMGGVVGADA
jgi:simple sugar transport system ATP-binding protein